MKIRWVAGVLLLFASSVAGAATLRVPGEYPTIQAGIDSAAAGDTVLVSAGTYTGTGNRDIGFGGRDLTLVSEDGPAQTTIDCQGEARAFLLEGQSRAAVVEGFTILNGFAHGSGGGMRLTDSSLAVRFCVFSGCYVQGLPEGHDPWPAMGGAVYVGLWSDALFSNCSFVGNEILGGPSYGTDVALYTASVTLQDCLFAYGIDDGELHGSPLGLDGGAPDFTIEQCIFTDAETRPSSMHVTDPGLCDWYPGSQIGFELCSDSPALPEHNDWGVLVGAFGAGCGPCVTAVERTSWGAVKALYR